MKFRIEKLGCCDDQVIADPVDHLYFAEMAEKAGLYFTRGDNKRLPGWMQCHRRLRFDENGRAGMYVFSNCEQFIRTIPLLRYSHTDPEDADSSGEDHIADEWRYACMSRPMPAPRPVPEEPLRWFRDPLKR